MKYPVEVAKRIALLEHYTETEELNRFDIFHLYSGKLAYPDGYYDTRFFELVGFNSKTMQKRELGRHDAIDFNDGVIIERACIFADGATLLKFSGLVECIGNTQAISIVPCSNQWKLNA